MAAYSKGSYVMAAEAATEIVSQKLEILLSRLELVGCSPMENLVGDARAKLATIQKFVSAQDGPSESTEWWGRLLQTMYNLEEILDKFDLKVARGRHEALHVATRPLAALVHKYMLWRDLSNLVKAMKELCQDQYLTDEKEAGGERKAQPASSSSHANAPWECQKLATLTNFWDLQASMNIDCHLTEKTGIKEQIRENCRDCPYWISILGEQGTGKTFLARWVYREAMSLGFDTRAWVRISDSVDKQEFLFEILKQVDKRVGDAIDFNEIEKMLSQKLAEPKRFLIVLDDVRPSDEELLEGLLMIIDPEDSQGLIITTSENFCIYDTDFVLETSSPLRDDESQKMLATKLRRGPHDPNLTSEEVQILKRFPAVPLCISLLGGLLSHAEEPERAALVKDSKMSVSGLLKLSYHKLPVYLKPCLIYMALFPVASPISTRRLVRLWLAEGLLDSHCCDRERKRTPEEVGETFILELVERNVIDVVSWRADGSPKACQMLTSMYDLICQATMGTGFLHVYKASTSRGKNDRNPTGQQQQLLDAFQERPKVRWLAEHTNIVRDIRHGRFLDLNLGHVRSFLSFYLRRGMLTEDISKLLRMMTSKADYSLLRVLDLEGVYKPSLEGVLRKLVLLRYLGLRFTVLDSISSEVGDLHYLETLDIKHTKITSLPSSLWKARKLRHLHLNWFYIDLKKILKICGDNVMALTELQTLSGLVIGEVKENSMTGQMNSLTTLTTLKLFLQRSSSDTSGAAGKTVADWISLWLTNLQSLTFGVIQEAKPVEEPKPGKDATRVAEPAKEEATRGAEPAKEATRVAEPATSQIGPLPELSLAQHHKLLELYLLGQLNNPTWTQLLPGSLRVLTLSGSNVRTDMIPKLGVHLKNLRTLRLLANSIQGETMKFINDGFPSLKVLRIWKLPQLEKVIFEKEGMPHLEELEFRHLERLENVTGIKECKRLEKVILISLTGALVDKLKLEYGTANLHEEDTKRAKSTTTGTTKFEDRKVEMPHPQAEKDTKKPKSADDGNSD